MTKASYEYNFYMIPFYIYRIQLYCELFLLIQGLLWCNQLHVLILTFQINHTAFIIFCIDRHEVGFQENTHKEDTNHGGNVVYLKTNMKTFFFSFTSGYAAS